MIVTVTPNPSLDRTYEVPALERGAVLRAGTERTDPGGKGVNVSRAVAAAGRRTVAVLPLGGAPGALVARLLAEQGIEVASVPVTGVTRSNVALAEPDGTLTKINAPGPELSAAEAQALLAEVLSLASASNGWVACCGSLPRGVRPDWYAVVVARARAAGARVAVDTSGPALLAALRSRPDVVKPNAHELAGAVGRTLRTVGDVVAAARELRARGAGAVLASLGADGQVLVAADGVRYGHAAVGAVRSDVGAGDASLAGFLAASRPGSTSRADCTSLAGDTSEAGFTGEAGDAALAAAVAHGAAAVQLAGSLMPTPADLAPEAVAVTRDVPLDRALTEQGSPR